MCPSSISPETLFEQEDRLLTTRPHEGDYSSALTNQADLEEAAIEADPFKNRAENMMIVDLSNDMEPDFGNWKQQVTRLAVEQYLPFGR